MFETIIGWLLLGVLVVTICGGYALLGVASKLIRKGPAVVGVLLLVVYSWTWCVPFLIVTWGPFAVVLMKPRS